MAGIDKSLASLEQRQRQREEALEKRHKSHAAAATKSEETVTLASSTSSSGSSPERRYDPEYRPGRVSLVHPFLLKKKGLVVPLISSHLLWHQHWTDQK